MIFQRILLLTVFKLKVSTFGFELITYGIKTLKNKNSIICFEKLYRERGVGTNPYPSTLYRKRPPPIEGSQ